MSARRSWARQGSRWAARRALWLGVCLVAALVAALAVGCSRGGPGGLGGPTDTAAAETQATPVTVVTVERDTIQEQLELTGTCEAFEEVDVVPEVSGKVVAVFKDVGDRVKAGEPLVRLDTALVSQQRLQAERGVEVARARLAQAAEAARLTDQETLISIRQAEQAVAAAREMLRKAEEAYKLQRDKCESDIQQARVALATAESQERDVAAGARTQEIAQAEAALRQAESDLHYKQTMYERYRRLYEQGAVAEATLDTYRTQYEVAQQARNQAREALSLAQEGARTEQRRIAALAVERAREQLRLALAGRRQVEIAARDVQSARVNLRQAEEGLRLARASRGRYGVSLADVRSARAGVGQALAGRNAAAVTQSKYTIYAPISGVVAQRRVDVGEGAGPGMSVMRIVDSNPIRVFCQVSELDIAKIKINDEGIATVDGLPGKQFLARVADITPQAIEDQRNYIVRAEVDNSEGLIKAGMFARVRLTISQKENVVVVDRDCLLERGAERRAYVVENGVIRIRKVKVGITDGRRYEIVEGLRGGEQVVYGGQTMLAEGQRVQPVHRQSAGTQRARAGTPSHTPTAPAPTTDPSARSEATPRQGRGR